MASVWNCFVKHVFYKSSIKVFGTPVRFLNLQEYQSKILLQQCGVSVQDFRMLDNADSIEPLSGFNVAEYVIKAQILAGGRGKGHFDNGFKGGVHITKSQNDILPIVQNMLGHRLITKQTPSDGILVRKVMVAQSVDIVRETYVCILMDRKNNGPVIIASPSGGMDIEAVAEKTPHLIITIPIDINIGMTDEIAKEVAQFLQFKDVLQEKAINEIKKLWSMFQKVDAVQLEINPLAETTDGKVITVDAKISFDDSAEFRQKDVFAMEDTSETDPREDSHGGLIIWNLYAHKKVEAAKHNLNYIGMDGNIGCLVNGAGLAMATMDIIKLHGGNPANFLDVGGAVSEDQVLSALKILTCDSQVKAILVNVFGGIVNCATIANGLVNASKILKLDVPIIVRLEGTNVDEAREIIKKSNLPILTAHNLDDAAQKAIRAIQ